MQKAEKTGSDSLQVALNLDLLVDCIPQQMRLLPTVLSCLGWCQAS